MSDYITAVIKLPEDMGQRNDILDALPIGGDFKGGMITAMGMGDEMKLLYLIENHEDFDRRITEDARRKMKVSQNTTDIV
jgi:hypothetical protein